jgi:hypothetical protein
VKPNYRDEAGIAMITAVMVVLVATLLSIFAVNLALHSLSTTSVDRKLTQSIGAAEAGIDLSVSAIQTSGTALPCGTRPTTSLGTSNYTVTITYYDTFLPTDAALACPPGGTLPATPVPKAAALSSVGSTSVPGFGQRTMQALVSLSPVPGPGSFDKAVFANSNVNFVGSNAKVVRQIGQSANADVYTNGDYVCNSSGTQSFDGSVYAQGNILVQSACSVSGDWFAKLNVTSQNQSNVGGNVESVTGNVNLSDKTAVVGNVYAYGTITTTSKTTVGGQKIAGYRAFPANAPPSRAFPALTFDSAAWNAAGYTNQITVPNTPASSCATILATMAAATANTVINTPCVVSFPDKTTLSLSHNVAIFSTGGFTSNGLVAVDSTVSGQGNLYLIVPSTPATNAACIAPNGGQSNPLSPDINLSNRTSFGNASVPQDIAVLLYTPCAIIDGRQTPATGQEYAGTTMLLNGSSFNLTYQPLPIYGSSGGGPTVSYLAGLAYKREVIGS